MINPVRFARARAAVLTARAKSEAFESQLAAHYGWPFQSGWLTSAQRAKRERLHAAYDRAAARIWVALEGSPRDWRLGVPAAWVVEELTYADAIALLSEPLSVQPPCAYGFSKPIA